ncbi:MAG: hypothetical protein HC927_12610 [Deltaproteobacteria bacterium]|nr:hypothetical protein [Deltaproteobacteria bacterium]
MTAISQLGPAEALSLERRLQRAIHRAPSLEAAAQEYARTVYMALSDSLVLLRVFAIVPWRELPAEDREFVRALSEAADMGAAISPDTPVLSLLGTMGTEPEWCERRRSVGHLGIPLISSEFVAGIPMISRLLKQIGVALDWIDRSDVAIVGKTFGIQSGVFYVADAATAVDSRGRKIIAAQPFVARHGVRTVFGVGGGYVGTPVYTTIIGFCRDAISPAQTEGFRGHIARFKAETEGLVKGGRIFSA